MIAAGEPASSPNIQNAVKFLLKHQNPNGGWGEDFSSCFNKSYAKNGMQLYGDEGSGVVCTAWALLSLIAVYENISEDESDKSGNSDYEDHIQSIDRGIKYLIECQLSNGDWPQQGIAGVFNRACGITYSSYRNMFPLWALSRHAAVSSKKKKISNHSTKTVKKSEKSTTEITNKSTATTSTSNSTSKAALQLSVSLMIVVGVCLLFRDEKKKWPSPVGLMTGVFCVIVAQIITLIYYIGRRRNWLGVPVYWIQKSVDDNSDASLAQQVLKHITNPEGFVLLVSYLTITWMFEMLPQSYYQWDIPFSGLRVVGQLLIADFLQYVMHIMEHCVSSAFYRWSHKPHHHITSPQLTDSFDGSLVDTLVMILIPLLITAQLIHASVWEYMAFGSLYSSMLCLIHTEFTNPWDPIFRKIGLG